MKQKKAERLVKKTVKGERHKDAEMVSKPSSTDPLKIPPGLLDMLRAQAARNKEPVKDPFAPCRPPPKVVGGRGKVAMDQMPVNVVASIGGFGGFGPGSPYAQGYTFQGYQELALLAQIPEYRRLSEVISTEMTRNWIKLKSTSDNEGQEDRISELDTELKRLRAQEMFRKTVEFDNYFGRAHLYLDTGDGTNREELMTSIGSGRDVTSREKMQKGKLRALRAIEPVWTYPSRYNSDDPLSATWYTPETWFVMGKELHVSRLLCFISREVPDLVKPAFSFGGLSLTQMAKPYVNNWLNIRQSIADLIRAFSVFVLKTDLQTSLQPGGDELMKRAELFNLIRDLRGLMLVNKETEDFGNVSTPLGSLDALQAQAQEHMAAVSGIPIVKLLGIQPAGLNASSEGEIRSFYDWIYALQEKFFRPHLTTVIDFAMLNIWGEIDEDITFDFEPLWSLDDKTLSDMQKSQMDTICEGIDHGIVSQEEGRLALASNPDSMFQGLDVDDIPEMPEEPEPGNIRERLEVEEGTGEPGPGEPQKAAA